jgi:hypothetical protein
MRLEFVCRLTPISVTVSYNLEFFEFEMQESFHKNTAAVTVTISLDTKLSEMSTIKLSSTVHEFLCVIKDGYQINLPWKILLRLETWDNALSSTLRRLSRRGKLLHRRCEVLIAVIGLVKITVVSDISPHNFVDKYQRSYVLPWIWSLKISLKWRNLSNYMTTHTRIQ